MSSDGSTPALQGGVHPGRTVTRWVGLAASATDAATDGTSQTSCRITAAGAMHDDLAGLGNVRSISPRVTRSFFNRSSSWLSKKGRRLDTSLWHGRSVRHAPSLVQRSPCRALLEDTPVLAGPQVLAARRGSIPADVKVREIIRELERDGWQLDRQVGSHRQFRHPTRPGTVTVPGHLGDDLARGTLGSIRRQAGLGRTQ